MLIENASAKEGGVGTLSNSLIMMGAVYEETWRGPVQHRIFVFEECLGLQMANSETGQVMYKILSTPVEPATRQKDKGEKRWICGLRRSWVDWL